MCFGLIFIYADEFLFKLSLAFFIHKIPVLFNRQFTAYQCSKDKKGKYLFDVNIIEVGWSLMTSVTKNTTTLTLHLIALMNEVNRISNELLIKS